MWIKWIYQSKVRLFFFFWFLLLVIYLPARQAGFVSDFSGWLYDLQNSSFIDHINRTHFKVKSLYQFTQLVTWFFYQLFGIQPFLWHCLHISFHAFNATLLFFVCSDLFLDFGKQKVKHAILGGSIFFCISPSLSEVIVWEPSFHYLLGFSMFLGVIRFTQLYLKSLKSKWLFYSTILYFFSSFSIELFYTTPFCVAGLLVYAVYINELEKEKIFALLSKILLPLFLILGLHFLIVKLVYGHWLPHISASDLSTTQWHLLLSKPLKNLFHLLFLGRFFSQNFRDIVYSFCESYWVIFLFYLSLCILGLSFLRNSQTQRRSLSTVVLFSWVIIQMVLTIPLWFPNTFWVVFDRYLYFSMGFIFIFLSIIIQKIKSRVFIVGIFILLVCANLYALFKVNKKWQVTALLTQQLMEKLPLKSDKKVLLLNMPQCMNGVFMISANANNEAHLIRNLLYTPKINYEMIDVCGNNILSVNDGAHVKVLNDSTIRVVLNQWGTWWWYNDLGAANLEHPYFKREMDEYGYNLILKGSPSNYLLLYQVGNRWKVLDFANRDTDQY
jgi:hypothetical protein